MGRSTRIKHPTNGSDCFGYIPEIPSLGTERAPIYLLEGFHIGGGAGRGRGFGVIHIEKAHAKELANSKCASVAEYVAQNVCSGVPICSEGGYTSRERVLAMRTKRAIVVMEYRQDRGGAYWSVITAYVRGSHLPARELAVVEAP